MRLNTWHIVLIVALAFGIGNLTGVGIGVRQERKHRAAEAEKIMRDVRNALEVSKIAFQKIDSLSGLQTSPVFYVISDREIDSLIQKYDEVDIYIDSLDAHRRDSLRAAHFGQ